MFVRRLMQLGGAGLVAVLAACGGGGGGGGGINNPPVIPPVTQTMNVAVVNNEFNPPNAGIAAGNTVTWTWNSGGTDHNVQFSSGPTIPAGSGTKSTGTFQSTFSQPGQYRYVCTIHSNMEGYVTVN